MFSVKVNAACFSSIALSVKFTFVTHRLKLWHCILFIENLIANDKEKIMFKVTENTGVAAEKLYGNTLKGNPPSLY